MRKRKPEVRPRDNRDNKKKKDARSEDEKEEHEMTYGDHKRNQKLELVEEKDGKSLCVFFNTTK